MVIENKFELGQDVYLVAERKALFENKCTCDVCLGSGRITYRGYNTQCPMCNGRKEVVTDSKSVLMHYVEENPCNIISYRFTVSRTGNVLRYKIKVGDREKNVPEDSLFATLEEAEARCKELTLEKIRREERY